MRHDLPQSQLARRGGRGFRTRCLVVAVTGLTVLIAAGCGGGGSAGGTVGSAVVIAAMPGVDTATLYLAQKDGYFAADGLQHVVIRSFATEPEEIKALQSGQVDIAASDYGDIFVAQSQSPDLRILADGYDATTGVLEVLTWPGSPIASPTDLAGRSIGVPDDDVLQNEMGSTHPVSLESAAATEVLTNFLGNDVETVSWDPMSQQQEVTELAHHKIDAVLLSEPYIYEAQSEIGATEVLDACSGSTASLPLSGYVATNAWVKDHPGAAADFQAAITKAATQASMTGQVQQILPKTAGMTATDADLSTIGTYPTTTSAAGLERVVRLLTDLDIISPSSPPLVPPMIVKPRS